MSAIPPNMIGRMWPQLAPHIQRVIDVSYEDITLLSIRNKLVEGEATAIAISNDGGEIVAVATFEVTTLESQRRILLVPVIGGDHMEDWADDFMKLLRELKQDFACDEIRGAGRPGWVKYLKKYGWKPVMTVVSLED